MKSRKNTKRALLSSVVALVLCFSMLLGSTFAWFTDSVVSANNVITSGNLDLEVQYTLDGENWNPLDGAKDLFQKDLWEPGHTEVVALKIENNGSLALKYVANMNIVAEKAGINKDGNEFKLSNILTVDTINMDTGAIGDVLVGVAFKDESTLQYTNTAYFKEANILGSDEMLLAGASKYIVVKVDMDENVGNEANHKGEGFEPSINFGINVLAAQYTYENDSFGNQYDKDAEYTDPIFVSSAAELKDAMLVRDGHIVLADDIVVDSSTPLQWGQYMFVANGRKTTIDLNGHNIILDETASDKIVYMFTTANGGTLNIVGDGNLISQNGTSGICWGMNKNDQINIYGGTYKVNGDEWSDDQPILYTTSGNIDVYGGKFYGEGHWISNASDTQGDRLSIVFHEGALLASNTFQQGDNYRIQLAEGCTLKKVVVDGVTWYQVIKE